ncbi:DMT family transporter (plasmid) [Azospirillum argentinense]|uniref:DMT family transporter n=1 Tax=Azospirillum argentinense TaxID=2970906 RepID=A0A4D8PMD5_9PROT|nr:DMT family transporter [Azospirillum argentinense]QCN99282.1 DMT family transporter [Azospirillum argentinense]
MTATEKALSAGSSGRAGIAWMLLTTLLFVTQDATLRFLVQTYPFAEVAWARFAVHLAIAFVVVAVNSPSHLIARRPGVQILRSTLLAVLTLLVAVSYKTLPFVDVAAIANVAPVLVTVLSVPLLKEKVGWRRSLGVLGGFIGAMIIIGPASLVFQWAILLPLAAALCNALYQIVTRLLRGGDSTLTTFLYTSMAGTVLCGLLLPFGWVTPDLTGAALMIMLGLLGACSHYCLIRAYTVADAATVAPFGYTTLIWAVLYGLLIFGESPSASTLAGGLVIVASGIYIFHREQVRAREAAAKSAAEEP